MITEDYCSYEVAKLLKEKGFNEPTWTRYEDDNEIIFGDKYDWNNSPMGQITAPTLQMAMKWLREVHKTFISITYENDGIFTANLKVPLKGVDCMIDNKHNCWLTYEEAAEVAVKYCLENLI